MRLRLMFGKLLICVLTLSCVRTATPDEPSILSATQQWNHQFGIYVQQDPSYQLYLHTLIEVVRSNEHSHECKKSSTNKQFSMLRCATCYSIALNDSLDNSIFLQAINQCNDIELYQVFVATDSFYSGATPTQKAQTLKIRAIACIPLLPGEVLFQTGSLFDTLPWLKNTKKIQDFILQDIPWVASWYEGRAQVLHLLGSQKSLNDIALSSLIQPYTLHQLNMSDFKHQAHIWVPALYSRAGNEDWCDLIQGEDALPEQQELYTLTEEIRKTSERAERAGGEMACNIIANATWFFFDKLNAKVSREQWSDSLTILRKLPFVTNYIATHPESQSTLFAFKERGSQPQQNTLHPADYCFEHYIRPLMTERAKTLAAHHTFLTEHKFEEEEHKPKKHLSKTKCTAALHAHPIKPADIVACLEEQSDNIHALLSQRCCFLWRLASESPLPIKFWTIYGMCTLVEKNFLYKHALKLPSSDDQRKELFTKTHCLVKTQNDSLLNTAPYCVCSIAREDLWDESEQCPS